MTRRRPAPEAEQARITRRYDRLARIYDIYDAPMDMMGGRRRRRRVIAGATGSVLEVGIGTGRNLALYAEGIEVTGIDVAEHMIERAARRASRLGMQVRLDVADVQALPFADDSFDTVTATCVFCSVADPVRGLAELRRVVRPQGRILLLEHVRPRNRFFGWLADLLTPITRRLFGPAINRRTEENVKAAGLEVMDIARHGIWREIVARPDAAVARAPDIGAAGGVSGEPVDEDSASSGTA